MGKETIYDALCRLNGYPLLDAKEEYVHRVLAVQVMTTVDCLVVIPATGMTLDGLDEMLHDTDYKGFPVVTSTADMTLVGFINRSEMKYAVSQARQHRPGSAMCFFTSSVPVSESGEENVVDLRPWTDQTPITVTDIYQMDLVIDLFRKMGLRYVIVTNRGKLSGLITKKDVLRHVNMMKYSDRDPTYLQAIERRQGHQSPALSPRTAEAAQIAAALVEQ